MYFIIRSFKIQFVIENVILQVIHFRSFKFYLCVWNFLHFKFMLKPNISQYFNFTSLKFLILFLSFLRIDFL